MDHLYVYILTVVGLVKGVFYTEEDAVAFRADHYPKATEEEFSIEKHRID